MSAATDYIQLTHAASEIDGTIDEVYAARGTYGNLSLKIASKQDALTTAQLAAANSGITAAKLTADEAAIVEVVDAGAKNVLNVTSQTTTISGVTFTVNGDKTITVTGTAGATNVAFNLYTGSSYIANDFSGMIVSDGSPESTSDVYLYYAASNNGSTAAAEYSLYGDASKEIGIFPYVRFAILVKANASIITPITIKPMICIKAEWAISQAYQPYCPSMQEMYQMILALQNGTRSAPALAMSAEPEESRTEPEVGSETGEEGEQR